MSLHRIGRQRLLNVVPTISSSRVRLANESTRVSDYTMPVRIQPIHPLVLFSVDTAAAAAAASGLFLSVIGNAPIYRVFEY